MYVTLSEDVAKFLEEEAERNFDDMLSLLPEIMMNSSFMSLDFDSIFCVRQILNNFEQLS